MTTPTLPMSAIPSTEAGDADATASLTAMWGGRSPAAASDAVWVPVVSGALVLVAGTMSLATKQPWLFAGLGPTVLLLASNPGHATARFHNIVVGHVTGLACAWLSLLLLGAATAPTLFGGPTPVVRVWASAFAVALTAAVQPSLRADHPPAAATALLVTLGVYKATWKTSLHLLAGVLVVAIAGEWFRRVRLAQRERAGRASLT